MSGSFAKDHSTGPGRLKDCGNASWPEHCHPERTIVGSGVGDGFVGMVQVEDRRREMVEAQQTG
jgi:hypothetical protein